PTAPPFLPQTRTLNRDSREDETREDNSATARRGEVGTRERKRGRRDEKARGRATMRRSSKKSSSSSAAAVPTKAVSKEIERIDQLFYTYADGSSSMIDPEGIETLCSHLEVPHTDVRILMLAWENGL
uniref:Defective in cullin neddylation protein n=1 Tax=Aegilops tauschii subsp. strangulata TaxID=200361 RepID=A0A453RTQ4_AEGTS